MRYASTMGSLEVYLPSPPGFLLGGGRQPHPPALRECPAGSGSACSAVCFRRVSPVPGNWVVRSLDTASWCRKRKASTATGGYLQVKHLACSWRLGAHRKSSNPRCMAPRWRGWIPSTYLILPQSADRPEHLHISPSCMDTQVSWFIRSNRHTTGAVPSPPGQTAIQLIGGLALLI